VNYALEHSIDLQRQEHAIDRERLALQEGKWAFVPRLSASTSYTMSTGRVLDPTTYEFVKTNYTGNNSASVSGDVTLFEGGRKIHTLSRARLSLRAAHLQEESLKYNLRIQIAGAFMDVLCAREQERIAGETVSLIESQLTRTQSLYDAGSVTETDVLQLQTQLSAARKDASSASYAYDRARLALCDLLEWEDYKDFEVAEPGEMVPERIGRDVDSILDNHPDIRAAALRKDLAGVDYKLALAAISPRLSLSAGFGTSYSDARQKALFNEDGTLRYEAYPFFEQYSDNGSAYVSVSLSIPILNGLSTRNGIKRARIAAAETELTAQETRKKVRRQILLAQMDCVSAKERYDHSLEETRYAEEVFRQVERKYNLGAVDFLRWNTAAVDLAKARYAVAEAKYTYLLRTEILNCY
jgi:Outer membrane protein